MITTARYQVEWRPSAGWVDISDQVLHVAGGSEMSGSPENALAFGDSAESTADVEVRAASLAAVAWARTPIRITFTINGVAANAFGGIVVERAREGERLQFRCTGYAELIRATKAYSPPFYLRPVATKTSGSSIDDPGSPSYAAGLVNWILWQAGGRPIEQAASYPSAAFFYSCDQAALAPTWSWAAGEDGWAECQKLAQAAGGQMFQRADGTVCYRQPYGYADATPLATFDEAVYRDVREEQSAARRATAVRCTYLQRAERPMQQVAEESTPRLIFPGEAQTIVVEPSWPITTLDLNGNSLPGDALQMTFGSGEKAVLGQHYTATASAEAQQITLVVTSITSYPLQLWGYTLRGKPIMASEGGSVVVGASDEQRTLDDNPYIQSEQHARRLASLYLKYYAAPRPVRTLQGCVFDPARTVGEVVNLTVSRWGIVAQPHIILSISHDETGLLVDYRLAYVGDLPRASEYFQVGPSYAGQSKKIAV